MSVQHPHRPTGLACLLLAGCAAAAVAGWMWWRQRPVQVAVDIPLLADGVIWDPSARYTAELFLEDRPHSRIRLVNLFSRVDPASSSPSIAALKRQGVQFFISSHPSSHALRSLPAFSAGDALAINAAAASNALSGRDDYFFRVVPDLLQEQQALARSLLHLAGRRLLVLQDTSNPAYTRPALASFRSELQRKGHWQLQVRQLLVSDFDAQRDQALLRGNFDAVYILAGSFQPAIGNLSQLVHRLHPEASILLTPWARSPVILANAGPAAARIQQLSPYPPRRRDQRVNAYVQRFQRRYGFSPNTLAIGTRQALELLDHALASGAQTPADVKRYLLSKPEHLTSFGPIRFDATGDVQARFHVFPAKADQAP